MALDRLLPAVLGFAVAGVIGLAIWTIDRDNAEDHQKARYLETLRRVTSVRAGIEAALNQRLYLVRGLSAFARTQPDFTPLQFKQYARTLQSGLAGVRSLQLAPMAVVTHIYPLQGNEAAIGHDLLADPARREAVQRTIDERTFVLAGPVNLRQGGVALIGRLPVFQTENGKDRFWGLAVVLVDLAPLLAEAGLDDPNDDLIWALRGKDGLGAQGEVFFGPPELFTRPERIVAEVTLPNGSWLLTAMPALVGTGDWRGRGWLWSGGLLLLLSAGWLVFNLSRGPRRLRQAVLDATAALEAQTRLQQVVIDGMPIPVYLRGVDGTLLKCNPAFAAFAGQARDALIGQPMEELPEGIGQTLRRAQPPGVAGADPHAEDVALTRGDGVPRKVQLQRVLIRTAFGKAIGELGAFVDLTERRRTEDLLRGLAEGPGREVGQEFFSATTRHLRNVLGADYAYIGQLRERADGRQVEVVAASGAAKTAPFAYPVSEEIYENHMKSGGLLVARGAEDGCGCLQTHEVIGLGLKYCVSQPLRNFRGDVLGVVAVLYAREPADSVLVNWLIGMYALRITAELERSRIEEQRRIAGTVFDNSADAILVTDAGNRILAVNPAFERITGYTTAEVMGRNPSMLASGRHDTLFYKEMWDSLHESGHWEGEVWNRRKSGEVYPEWLSINVSHTVGGVPSEYVALFTDITLRKRDEERVWRQANYDGLTGLPNRILFMDRLNRALAQSRRSGRHAALMFLDLDRFKWVNDNLGHAAGDQLLQEASQRLTEVVREVDTVARLSGDEFTVVLPDIKRVADAERVADKILERNAEAYHLEGNEAFVSASIGITIFPDDGDNAESLLRNADNAMYQAKQSGRNAIRFFTEQMNIEALDRAQIERDLHRALENDELMLHFQPIVSLTDGAFCGGEALLRWQHPRRGILLPAQFLPIAEECGLMRAIGSWVIARVCSAADRWREAELPRTVMAVNVSPLELRDLRLPGYISNCQPLCEPAWDLMLEFTENALEQDENLVDSLTLLRDAGARLALDDFGTGSASLGSLRKLPVEWVKIDGAMIHMGAIEPESARLIEAIVALAHSLGLKVVAEAVETEAHLALARLAGCDFAQGYLFAKPQTLGDLIGWVRDKALSEDESSNQT